MNKPVIKFLRELTIVVLGVLIALFINNWNESLKHQRFLDKTLYAISKEITFSKQDVEETLDRHYLTLETFRSKLEDNSESINEVFESLGGFQIPQIKNIGLKYFIANHAELVDYSLISDLSEIEFVSKGFEMKLNKLMEFGYEHIESREPASKMKFAQILSEVIESEEQLIAQYEDFLNRYQASLQEVKE